MLESKNSKNISNDLKNTKIVGFYAAKQWEKTSNGPPLGSFSREKVKLLIFCQNDSASRRSFFANWTKKIFPTQNRNFDNGVIVKISKSKVLRGCPCPS